MTESEGEDRIAALALGKTVAFLFYSFLTFPVLAVLDVFLSLSDRNPWLFYGVWLALEVALLYPTVRGWLPGTSGQDARPFNEQQLALGCAALSAIIWVLPLASESYRVLEFIVNGSLILGTTVYFLVKSVLSRRPRWAVLAVGAIPAVQLIGLA